MLMIIEKMFFHLAAAFSLCLAWVAPVFAEWTPLVDAAAFNGIKADVSTAVAGIVTIALIILGAALLMRALK